MNHWVLFFLAQLLCIVNCTSGVVVQIINTTYHTNLPFTVMAFFYVLQLPLFLFKKNRQAYGWKKFMMAVGLGFIDGASNVCCVYAYKYADVASIVLLLSTVVPFCMIFSFLIIKTRYSYAQVACALITCMLAVLYTLIDKNNSYQTDNKLLGDILTILSALGFAFSSTLNQKVSVGMFAQNYLCRQAIGGSIFCIVLMLIVEIKTFKDTPYQAFCLMIPNGVLFQIFYFLEIFLTQRVSAVKFNMSTLCTNIYTFISSAWIMHTSFQPLQVLPAIGILASVLIYFRMADSSAMHGASEPETGAVDGESKAEQNMESLEKVADTIEVQETI